MKKYLRYFPMLLAVTLPLVLVSTGGYQFHLWDQVKRLYGLKAYSKSYELKKTCAKSDQLGKSRQIEKHMKEKKQYLDDSQSCSTASTYQQVIQYFHYPRSYLNYHIYKISQFVGYEKIDKIYSFQVVLNLLLAAFILGGLLKYFGMSRFFTYYFWAGFFFIALFMSGRLSYAFLGHTFLIKYYDERKERKSLARRLLLIMGLALCSVASGASTMSFTLCFFMWIKEMVDRKSIKYALPDGLILAAYFPLIFIAALKVGIYFDYSFKLLISHGAGVIFYKNSLTVNFVFILLIICLGIGAILKRKILFSLLNISSLTCVKLSIFLSFFGLIIGWGAFCSFFSQYLFLSGYLLNHFLKEFKIKNSS